MDSYGVKYMAVIVHEFWDGNKIIFGQRTQSRKSEDIAWISSERHPLIESMYWVQKNGEWSTARHMSNSIFEYMAVPSVIGYETCKLEYSIIDMPDSFKEIQICFEDLPCKVRASNKSVCLLDGLTNDYLCGSMYLWEGREQKSIYRVLLKMLSMIKEKYGVEYDISNFI